MGENSIDIALEKKDDMPGAAKEIFEWVESAVFAIITVVLLFTFIFRLVSVDGDSMNPSFYNGDRIVISNLLYTPKDGDVVVLVQPEFREDYPLIKRIIATEGETVNIDYTTGKVIVNGVVLNEPYISEPIKTQAETPMPFTVPKGKIFVMGDNRNASMDSRSSLIGPIDAKNVLGHVVFRIFPLNKIGVIKNGREQS